MCTLNCIIHSIIDIYLYLGPANGNGAGPLPDVAVAASDHGLAGGTGAIPALDLNYVDSK